MSLKCTECLIPLRSKPAKKWLIGVTTSFQNVPLLKGQLYFSARYHEINETKLPYSEWRLDAYINIKLQF